MHKLTNVEAQRIMAILEETHEKLSLLSYVAPGRFPDEDILKDLVGPEVFQVVQEQALLEQQYESVCMPQTDSRSFDVNKSLPDFETLDDELRHSTRVVCRMLKEDPTIIEKVQTTSGFDRTASIIKFLDTFNELKQQMYQKLSTSVEEEKSKEDYFLEISAREEKASQMLRALQKDLKSEKSEREKAVSARNETIQKLRDELEDIKSSTIQETKALEEEMKTREENDRKNFESKESALKEDLARLLDQLHRKSHEDRESEDMLRKKKLKNEGEVENWINKYDQDMEEKEREINALKAIYDEEKKQLAEYEEYFNKLMAEREARLAEQRRIAEEEAREQAQRATLSKAATMIQRIWRGKMARREMERKRMASAGKKGKKGGKKGGKGKKKK